MVDFALRSCGLRGHATFAPDEKDLRERLKADTPAGEAWRCLRCETFVVGAPRRSGPANTAPEIPRGRMLRDRTLMRALAVERALRCVIFLVGGGRLFKVKGVPGGVPPGFHQRPAVSQAVGKPDRMESRQLQDHSQYR